MPNLRSRQIPSPNQTRSTPPEPTEPISPTGPVRRRSLRLSSSSFTPSPKRTQSDADFTPSPKRTRNDGVSFGKNPNFDTSVRVSDVKLDGLGQINVVNQLIGGNEILSLRSGTRVVKRLSIGGDDDDCFDNHVELDGFVDDINNNDNRIRVRVRVSDDDLDGVIAHKVSIGGVNDDRLDGAISSAIDDVTELGQNEVINRENRVLSFRSGTMIDENVGVIGVEIDGVIDDVKELGQNEGNEFIRLRSGTVPIGGLNDDIIEVERVIGSVIHDIKELGQNEGVVEENKENEVVSLRSGTRIAKQLSVGGVDDDFGNVSKNDGSVGVFDVDKNRENGFLSLRSGTKVEKRVSIGGDSEGVGNVVKNDGDFDDGNARVSDVVQELGQYDGIKVEKWVSIGGDDDDIGDMVMDNREFHLEVKEEGVIIGGESNVKSRRRFSSDEKGKRKLIVDDQGDVGKMEEDDALSSFVVEEGLSNQGTNLLEERLIDVVVGDQCVAHKAVEDYLSVFLPGENMLTSPRRYTRDEKGKRQWIVDNEGDVVQVEEGGLSSFLAEEGLRHAREERVKSDSIVDDQGVVNDAWNSFSVEEGLENPQRYTREQKGKGVATSDDVIGGNDDYDEGLGTVNLELQLDFLDVALNPVVDANQGINFRAEVNEGINNGLEESLSGKQKSMREIHKKIARRNASKYAYFSMDDDENKNEGTGLEQEDENDTESDAEQPQEDRGLNVEDWPGPFSTAMKIIRDREKNLGVRGKNSCSNIGDMPLISWTPNNKIGTEGKKRSAPSLKTMCLKILAENVDAIHSLNYVPEVLRHKLCQMLCDSRRMNAHFFSLLLQGSPAEIRVADCSWLEEEEFESSIKACDTSKLAVLQLDLCGHCVSDSSLLKAVAPKGLPVLTTISLKGACRISDAGLAALVSAAPVLRSMNLSQCSLLTVVGIKTIADSLGSIVHELYLDDCDTLNAMSILPSLKSLVHLEVLSLRGIGGVSDKFIKKLITSNGQNMKELVLANCVNLTDSSLKVITEKCSQLCVLDLSYLRKLTDVGMAYLTNGCRGIQDLRLCRNAFSDDAIAAFLEASGQYLKELSLNNLTEVGQNTTLSLARRCKNLESLDLSWCRSLTDEAMGLIADSCMSLRLLKIFGCTQITKIFLDGHSNPNLHVVGMKLTPILDHIKRPNFQHGPLYYSAVPSS